MENLIRLEDNLISIGIIGKVETRPDLAFLNFHIKVVTPGAQESLKKCRLEVVKMREFLETLKDIKFRIDPIKLSPMESHRMPMDQGIIGIDAAANIILTMENIHKIDVGTLEDRVALILDGMLKMGANIGNYQGPFLHPDMAATTYSIKDPTDFERQAIEDAVTKSRPIAERTATSVGKKIDSVHSVIAGRLDINNIEHSLGSLVAPFIRGSYLSYNPLNTSVSMRVLVNYKCL